MIEITKEIIDSARDLIAHGEPRAVGYRLLIKPIEAITGMEKSEKAKFTTLAQVDFQTKTDHQRERESHGTHHGILVSIGDHAFQSPDLGEQDWVEVGDVVIFDRYAGVEVELPPGSGDKYRFTNDESILGKMEAK